MGKREVRVIGLSGYAGAGKDLVGALLAMRGFQRIAFGDALKDEVAEFICSGETAPTELSVGLQDALNSQFVTAEQVYEKPTSDLVRSILQQWGTEYRRARDPQWWVRLANARLRKCVGQTVVITDARFQNEVDWVKSIGGEVWKVERPGVTQLSHVSEAVEGLTGIDRVITNSGMVYDLAAVVMDALQ